MPGRGLSVGYARRVMRLPELATGAPVSVVMPVLNEEAHLAAACRSVLDNGYDGEVELVIALGPSADATDTIARGLAADPRVRLVPNPSGSTPTGLNAAIAASGHDVIVRVDGHTQLPTGYLATAVDALARTGAGNVGGRMVPMASAPFAGAVAIGMSSRWGIGGAGHRVGGREGDADSVFLGSFRRAALDAVGGFDEHFRRAQDWELNYRLRRAGYRVYFVPAMRVPYSPRSSVRALWTQFHDSGRWRREVVHTHPDSLNLRYLAAPLAVFANASGLVVGGVLLGVGSPLAAWALAVPVAYLAGVLVASGTHVRGLAPAVAARLPLVLITMHMAWGSGFVRGVR